MNESDLARLVEAAQAGEGQSWRELVDRLSGLVWSVARAFRLSADDAADVCQTVWLQLAQHLDEIHEPDRVGLWLMTTARRECLRFVRKESRQFPVDPVEVLEPIGQATAVEEHVVAQDRTEVLWRCLNELDDECRTLIRIFLADPVPTYAEAAAALDMPVGSVGPRRQRCIQKLRGSAIGHYE